MNRVRISLLGLVLAACASAPTSAPDVRTEVFLALPTADLDALRVDMNAPASVGGVHLLTFVLASPCGRDVGEIRFSATAEHGAAAPRPRVPGWRFEGGALISAGPVMVKEVRFYAMEFDQRSPFQSESRRRRFDVADPAPSFQVTAGRSAFLGAFSVSLDDAGAVAFTPARAGPELPGLTRAPRLAEAPACAGRRP